METLAHVEIYDMTLDLSMGPCIYSGHGAAQMAFFNDLVRVIAEVEGMDPMTVRGIGLSVREGGHISKGGRGLSAAKMTARDGANMLIGVNACTNASKAAEVVETYKALKPLNVFPSISKSKGVLKDTLLSAKGFGHSLEGLIELCIPTIGNVDLLGKFITEGISYNKNVREKLLSANVVDSVIKIEIKFVRPMNTATIELHDASTGEVVLSVNYGLSKLSNLTDRYDLTAIGLKTIRAVGSIVYN